MIGKDTYFLRVFIMYRLLCFHLSGKGEKKPVKRKNAQPGQAAHLHFTLLHQISCSAVYLMHQFSN